MSAHDQNDRIETDFEASTGRAEWTAVLAVIAFFSLMGCMVWLNHLEKMAKIQATSPTSQRSAD